MRRTLISSGALVAAVAGSLVLAPAALASDGGDANHPTLRQQLPLKAADFEKTEAECLGVPANQDGWHFVLPGGTADFVELKVTFVPGGTQTITDFSVFGTPEGKHAYVASAPGAELTNVEATITGGPLPGKGNKFPLSHTCPATETNNTTGGTGNGGATGETGNGGATGETTTGETGNGGATGETTTGETTNGGATGETTTGETTNGGATTGETTATGGSTTGEQTTGGSAAGGSTTGETSANGGAATGGEVKDENGNLAETGSSAPVGIIAAAALALAAAGAVLVTRRRKATQN